MKNFEFDAFISHASEDKAGCVEPLAKALKGYGLKVWYDRFTLKAGDSLHDSIENGLARSRYGVVILSRKFLSKRWPREELNGLFARNLEARKVILPVWHNISSARIRAVLPMIADKFALRTSDGIEHVARSLVEIIRPELLELDVRRASAREAAESFISEAKLKYPGYDFSVLSNSSSASPLLGTDSIAPKWRHEIQIRIADPTLIANRLGGQIQFLGEGAKKAIEAERTGKPQKWEPGEFVLKNWNLPFMPANLERGILHVGERRPPNVPSKPVRVEIGARSPIVFPFMELRCVRTGTHESELAVSDHDCPLKMNIVCPVGSERVDFTISWGEITGLRASEAKKLVEAIDGLRSGRVLRLVDIRLERTLFESKSQNRGVKDPFSAKLRRMIFLAAQIEEMFSIVLRLPDLVSEKDTESLFHLDCLLNDCEYGQVERNTMRLVKADGDIGAAEMEFVSGATPAKYIEEPLNYPGYFPLFGVHIATRDWVRVIEFTPEDCGKARREFSDAPVGSEHLIEVVAKKHARLRWKEDQIIK